MVEAAAPRAADAFEAAKKSLAEDGGKEHLKRIHGSMELRNLMMAAKQQFAGAGLLEPEHLVLQLGADGHIDLSADQRDKLLGLAAENAEKAGQGMSERTKEVLIRTSLDAGAAGPTVAHLTSAMSDSPAEFGRITKSAVEAKGRDALLGGAAAVEQGRFKKLNLPTLGALGEDLVLLASEGKIDKAVGRNKEVQQIFRRLGMRQLSSIVLTGDRGVGKTAIAEGIANQIVSGEAPAGFENARLFRISADGLKRECNCPNNGGPTAVIEKLIAEAEQAKHLEPPAEVVLFIDEIHSLVNDPAIRDALKPALGRGRLRIIGASTTDEYKRDIREADPALADRLGAFDVGEPAPTESVQMVLANLENYADFHGVEIDGSAAQMAVELSKYSGMKRPRGAVVWLDAACSLVKGQIGVEPPAVIQLRNDVRQIEGALEQARGDDPDSKRLRGHLQKRLDDFTGRFKDMKALGEKEKGILLNLQDLGEQLKLAKDAEPRDQAKIDGLHADIKAARGELAELPERLYHTRVDAFAVAAAVSDEKGIDLRKLQQDGARRHRAMEQAVDDRVVGQKGAKTSALGQIRLAKAKLRDATKPVGVHLWLGPTGVGKTELAETLAKEAYDGNIIRFNGTEMMERHELAKLIGAPPGYVGHDGGSRLAEEIRKFNGHAVLFIDEAEKAHPDILKLLMQIMDGKNMRDNEGNEVDCSGLQIILASNLASPTFSRYAGDGKYTDPAAVQAGVDEAFARWAPPEVRNRFDSVDVFNPLSKADIGKILDIKLGQLAKRAANAQGLELTASAEAKAIITQAGFDPAMGGRPLNRALENLVQKPLADLVLEGGVPEDAKVQVVVKDGKLTFNVEAPR
ncbi:MAG: ATP-dependent Clp protease ATP-binding subunit [Deltaproteobacteria bacterium]|nr:ATP-dependent Clp protease ATP-binding subunit [Deltaproteobacteria bacterium]